MTAIPDFKEQKIEIASFIREVFSYITRFKGQLFVLKIEDSLMNHPLFPVLIRDISFFFFFGIKVLIVPGTRNSIDAQLKAWDISYSFNNGIRLTSEEALPLIEQASLGVAQRIMSHLTAGGCDGIQGNWVSARSLGIIDGADYMRTGKIEHIQRSIIERLLAENFIPIIPPIGWNKLGHAYNISSTELATELCKYLQVAKLFFIGNENGISMEGLKTSSLTKYLEVTDSGVISASDSYYNGKGEKMSDYDWDKLFNELTLLEDETGLVLPNSPTHNVSSDSFNGKKEAHEFPALSLAKTKQISELVKWADNRPIWMSWKLDGLTLVATYDNGKLSKIVTRGNGHIGTNITFLADAIDGIPNTI